MKCHLLLLSSFVLLASEAPVLASPYPIADKLAAKIVQKYQTSTCDQLAAERAAPPNARKEMLKDRAGDMLQADAGLRAAFIGQIASPVLDKMVVCGFIP